MSVHAQSAGCGADVVLLHGWGLHGGVWQETAEHLAARHRVTRIDLPGHGRSAPLPGDYTLERVTAAVLAALPERSTVIGWSLGGTVALALARHHPERVARLVLVAATPQFVATPDWPYGIDPAMLQGFAEQLERDYDRTLQRFLALQVLNAEAGRRALARLHAELAAAAPHVTALRGGLEILRTAALRDELTALAQPTALLYGERDPLVPAAGAPALCARLPQARTRLIRGAGHAPFLSHPAHFHAALDDILAEI